LTFLGAISKVTYYIHICDNIHTIDSMTLCTHKFLLYLSCQHRHMYTATITAIFRLLWVSQWFTNDLLMYSTSSREFYITEN